MESSLRKVVRDVGIHSENRNSESISKIITNQTNRLHSVSLRA